MKVYVISDNSEFAISAANQINGSGSIAIVSETNSEDIRDVLGDIKANTSSSFDMMLVLCHGAKDVAISANKIGGAMAVACKDQEDAIEAISSTRANVILVDSTRTTRKTLAEIVDGLLSAEQSAPETQAKTQQEREIVKEQSRPVIAAAPKQGPSVFSGLKKITSIAKSQQGQGQQKGKPLELPGRNAIKSMKKKGIANSLKDAFGLEDEKED